MRFMPKILGGLFPPQPLPAPAATETATAAAIRRLADRMIEAERAAATHRKKVDDMFADVARRIEEHNGR